MSKCTKCGCTFFKSIGFTAEKVCVICGKLVLSTPKVVMPFIPPVDKSHSEYPQELRARVKAEWKKTQNNVEVIRNAR